MGPVGPQGMTRPKHKRTVTGLGPAERKSIEASIPEPQRDAWKKHSAQGFKTKDEFENEAVKHIETTLARSLFNCDEAAAYGGTALAFRDRLVIEWNKTQQRQATADQKRVYYLSLEFLMGRALDNAMLNVRLKDVASRRSSVTYTSGTSLICLQRAFLSSASAWRTSSAKSETLLWAMEVWAVWQPVSSTVWQH